ncbi:MAG: YbaK/EbsC family protein [Synergistales bacterium]|jgi:prolyl-tRNA synthetase
MNRSKTLIPTSKNPPAKVKDKGLIRLARSGAAAYDASGDRVLWLPLGVALLERIRGGIGARFQAAGAQSVECGPGASGTLPVAVRVLKTEDQLPLCLAGKAGGSILLEGFDAEGQMSGWPLYAERLLSFLQERGLSVSVFEEALSCGERTLVTCSCDADARGALEARTCPGCGWTASVDALLPPETPEAEEERPLEPVRTPGATTIVELCRQLGCSAERTIKTMFYAFEKGDRKGVAAALVRGDRSVCATKLSRALGGAAVRRAESADLKQAGCDVAGFLGPVGLPGTIEVLADLTVAGTKNRVIGANQPETHYTGACWGRDYEAPVADISGLELQAPCPVCGKPVEKGWVRPVAAFAKGHPALGDFPSLGYLDSGRKRHVPGSWTGNVQVEAVALAASGGGDELFMIGLAPADAWVMALEAGGPEGREAAGEIAQSLEKEGWSVVMDDRLLPDEVRLAEAVLVGSPVRVLVSGTEEAEIALDGGKRIERVPLGEAVRFLESFRVD